MTLDRKLTGRYLRVLALEPQPPSLEALTELVRAHLYRIPFENISKLYRYKRFGFAGMPDGETFLDGIERQHFGGTCYANNSHFYELLLTLGYDVKLCGADMRNPDVHAVIVARVDGREYLVDVGYGAPFLQPMPRDLSEDFIVAHGPDRYVLKPQDPQGCSRLQFYQDRVLKHGYYAKPAPKCIEDFSAAIADSFRTDATFLNAVMLARFSVGESVVIHNLTLVERKGTETSSRLLNGRTQLAEAVEKYFGIERDLVEYAVRDIGALGDPWG